MYHRPLFSSAQDLRPRADLITGAQLAVAFPGNDLLRLFVSSFFLCLPAPSKAAIGRRATMALTGVADRHLSVGQRCRLERQAGGNSVDCRIRRLFERRTEQPQTLADSGHGPAEPHRKPLTDGNSNRKEERQHRSLEKYSAQVEPRPAATADGRRRKA